MQAKEQKIARREFLASIGKAVGGSGDVVNEIDNVVTLC